MSIRKFSTSMAPRREIELMLCGENSNLVFSDPEGIYFSKTSTADIFDVRDGKGIVHSDLHDNELSACIKTDITSARCDPRTRIVFIDGVQNDPNRLPITSALLNLIVNTYNITPRFVGFLSRQQLPGSALHCHAKTTKPLHYELWYSAVIRSLYKHGNTAPDLSRKVLDWMSFCVWSNYDVATKDMTLLVWRCPAQLKQKFYSAFQGNDGEKLQRHPMLIHAFLMEHIIVHTYDFLQKFSEPLYAWEFKANEMRSAEDYTRRSQSFLSLSRQIQQVATDYDILTDTVEYLQKAYACYEEELLVYTVKSDAGEHAIADHQEENACGLLGDVFERFQKEVKLIRTYSTLYVERTKIGVSECFAMVNQRDADINLKMAAESTQIARASHQDNRSLRVIQIMSMLFLPASLVASIFGMGFFNTSQGDNGESVFTISSNWWLFVAVSIPLTVTVLSVMGGYRLLDRRKGASKDKDQDSLGHPEKV